MKKVDEISNPTSCLNKASDDEPLFVLRAHDRLAPATVRDWAHRAKGLGVRQEKVNDAMEAALQMEIWQKNHPELMIPKEKR